jgi:uncharacterized membrane protein
MEEEMRRVFLLMIVCALLVGVPASNALAVRYEMRDLGSAMPDTTSTAAGITNQGKVLLLFDARGGNVDAYTWTAAAEPVFVTRASSMPSEYGWHMNNTGDIIYNGSGRAALLTPAEPAGHWNSVNLESQFNYPYQYGDYAIGLNDSGQVVGCVEQTAVLWSYDGSVTKLAEDGEHYWVATAINNSGTVALIGATSSSTGTCFVMGADRKLLELPMLAGTERGAAVAIGESGEIVGSCDAHAVLWHSDGSIVDLGGADEGLLSTAWDINIHVQAVGSLNGHATLWNPDGSVIDLSSSLPLANFSCAYAINDLGQIVGKAGVDEYTSHAVIWTPVPEPSSVLTLVGGICSVLCLLRKPGSPTRTT